MSNDGRDGLATCGCWLAVMIFNLFAGGWSVNYLLSVFAHKIPFFWAMIIGLVVGEISVPLAIVIGILKSFGVI